MSSAAQIAANRLNAARSTGPTSPEGKAASSRNAARHGLAGRFAVLPHESTEDYEALAAALAAEHQPEGDSETFLVERMIQARWKLQRIERLEAQAIEQALTDPAAPADPDAALLEAMVKPGGPLSKLARYAAEAERAYTRALRELRAARAHNGRAESKAMAAALKALVYAPPPGPDLRSQPARRNEPNWASQRPNLTPEDLAHPALRL